MGDIAIPPEIGEWIDQHVWGPHHLQWHTERLWDRLAPEEQRQLSEQMHYSRAAIQEGEAGNGIEFLVMHRAMIELLREQFPQYTAWFIGWPTPPTDPSDPNDPSPRGSADLFDPEMLKAIDRLTNQLAGFGSEDELGLYVETRLRPAAGFPNRLSPDLSSGIHNYLHNRFSQADSPINMGEPLKNLKNARFWRLHGWIDERWRAYRTLKGLSDSEVGYQQRLAVVKSHLRDMGQHSHPHIMLALLSLAARPTAGPPVLPLSALHPFRPTTARRMAELMDTVPSIGTRDDLIAYLQVAIQIEHSTLPLYLTAMWSIKDDTSEAYLIIQGIAFQEMLHMGIVCNLLRAIRKPGVALAADDARPQISFKPELIPHFPAPLPGLDLSDIHVTDIQLEPLRPKDDSLEAKQRRIKLFMRIEKPKQIPVAALNVGPVVPRFKTIGEFYDVVLAGLSTLPDAEITFDGTGQLTKNIDGNQLSPIANREDALKAILLIKEQGEGTSESLGPNPSDEEVAHYWRFDEILKQVKYVKNQGQWKLDPTQPVPFPTADEVYSMAPIPIEGYAESADFDHAYSEMLDRLQEAWDQADPSKLTASVGLMRKLHGMAVLLMKQELPNAGGLRRGPDFRYIAASERGGPRTAMSASPGAGGSGGEPASAPVGFARVKQILDEAVQGQDIGAHGAFWRSVNRDQFVSKIVRGLKLIVTRADGTFDPDESNLIKALEGRSPFGANLPAPPEGALFNRMPDGFAPVPVEQISELRSWIAAGCPDVASDAAPWFAPGVGGPADPAVHNDYWRDFDNWAAFNATDQTQADIDLFFGLVQQQWVSFAKTGSGEEAWQQAVVAAPARAAIERLERLQRETVLRHYGRPVPMLTLLDGYERFGDDSLPADPMRPADPRHRMNGQIMWFFWSAFVDASLRLATAGSALPADFWQGMARAILVGMLNDGLFRGRFAVVGFSATPDAKPAIRAYAIKMDPATSASELRRRYKESGL